jgi:hypothetical protein
MTRFDAAAAMAIGVAIFAGPSTGALGAQTFAEKCAQWIARKGYSVNYIEQRTGKRQPGFANGWVSNIDRDAVRPGDVAIFAQWRGHTGYVEKVERDASGKPLRILISDWNRPAKWVDEECVITEAFGKLNTWWVNASEVTRYWRPNP